MMVRAPRSLTPAQTEAISAQGKQVLVVAPAGSGKTEVLIQRVIRICNESRGDSFRLLAVTFTVRAAEELRQRAEASISDELWRIDADTLHGFALDWLRRYGQAIGVGPDVVVFADDVDRRELVAGYLQSVGVDPVSGSIDVDSIGAILRALDTHRTAHIDSPGCCSRLSYFGIGTDELFDAYETALRARGAIDFPGMLLRFRELLVADPWVLRQFRSLYRHIFVDEGQDLTPVQAALLRDLVGDELDVFVVADERQSINGFAGGSFSNALTLVRDAAESPLHLHHNFRCSREVLDAAEAVAAHMDHADQDVVSRDDAPPGRVRLTAADSPSAEADLVSNWVETLLEQGLPTDRLSEGEDPTLTPEDIAIIGRTRWTLDPIVAALSERGVQYVVETDAGALLAEPEPRILVDFLAFGVNDRDLPARRRAIDELRELIGEVDDEGTPLALLANSTEPSLNSVSELLRLALEGDEGLANAMERIIECGDTGGWPQGARVLASAWVEFRASTTVQGRSLRAFLLHLVRVQRTRPTDPGVRVLTIHRVKGLEFKAVALVGSHDGSIPHYRASTARELDEERRALYVAMTRAARELLVTWPRLTVDRYGRAHTQSPSRFLTQAGLVR